MMSHTADYRNFLEGFDMHETQKDDLIHILIRWAESFIDRALGLDSAQQATTYNQLAASQDSGKSAKFKRHPLTKTHQAITNNNKKP